MSDVSRPCVRCRRASVVSRGGAAYCLECNEIMAWGDLIAVVQSTSELPSAEAPPEPASVTVNASADAELDPSLNGGGSDTASADPFSRRLI